MQIEQLLSLLQCVSITAGILAVIPCIAAVWIAKKHSLPDIKKLISEAPPSDPKPGREKPPRKEKAERKDSPAKPVKPEKQKQEKQKQEKPLPAAKPVRKAPEKPAKKAEGAGKKPRRNFLLGHKKTVPSAAEVQPVPAPKKRIVIQLSPLGSEEKLRSIFAAPSVDDSGWQISAVNSEILPDCLEQQKGTEYEKS